MPTTRLRLDSRPASVRAARLWLAGLLDGSVNESARLDAVLLLSEVVANAVRHATGDSIHLAVNASPTHLIARVRDHDARPPVRRPVDDNGGWGLMLLNRLAARWGVDTDAGNGKTVWFELHHACAGTGAHALPAGR